MMKITSFVEICANFAQISTNDEICANLALFVEKFEK